MLPIPGEMACKIVNALPVLCILVSIYSLVLMSWERYRAIVTPLSGGSYARGPFTLRLTAKLIAGVWILSFLCVIPTLVEYEVYPEEVENVRVLTVRRFFSTEIGVELPGNDSVCINADLFKTFSLSHGEFKSESEGFHTLWSNAMNESVQFSGNQTFTLYQQIVVGNESSIRPTLSHQSQPSNQCLPYENFFVSSFVTSETMRCVSRSGVFSWFSGILLLMVAYVIPTIIIWLNYGRVIHFIIKFTKQTAASSNNTKQLKSGSCEHGEVVDSKHGASSLVVGDPGRSGGGSKQQIPHTSTTVKSNSAGKTHYLRSNSKLNIPIHGEEDVEMAGLNGGDEVRTFTQDDTTSRSCDDTTSGSCDNTTSGSRDRDVVVNGTTINLENRQGQGFKEEGCKEGVKEEKLATSGINNERAAVVVVGSKPRGDYKSSFVLNKRKVKIVKMLAIVAAIFELCWLPYFTLLIYAVSNSEV